MKLIKCDKCGTTVEDTEDKATSILISFSETFNLTVPVSLQKDLCKSCAIEIVNFTRKDQ